MTLLASERSILIRNKFRSVLQLRIQNRRQQNEINSEAGLKTTCAAKVGEKDSINSTRRASDSATQKSPPSGQTAETTQDRGGIGVQRQKKARLTENLTEKTEQRPGPVEFLHKRILPLENTVNVSYPLSSDVFEDDVSSCASSSPEQLGIHQSPCFSSSPGLAADQSLSELSPVATPLSHSPKNLQCSLALLPATEGISQPMSMSVAESNSMATTGRPKGIYVPSQATPLLPKTAQPQTPPPHPILGQSLASPRPPRPRKPRDSKPKMRKLKYHQYIPPDQRGGPGGGATNNSQRNNNPTPPIDSAYSRLLQQQQVFLQLQILNQQQQLTVATSGENQLVRLSPGTSPQSCPQAVPTPTNSTSVDASPTHKPELLPPNLDELTVSELRQQLRKRGLPVSGTKPALLERLRPFQMPRPHVSPVPLCQLDSSTANLPPTPPNSDTPTNPVNVFIQPMGMCEQGVAGYQTPPSSSSSSSPGLPEGSPLGCSATWRPEQATEELSVELKMRERMKNRSRERAHESANQTCGTSLHPFLQQEPGCSVGKTETERQEMLFPQVFSCHDVIGHDFELPMQITASPVQSSSSVRSLEEELQEAIQRVQMDPSQSIEDILEDSISGPEEVPTVTDLHSGVAALSGPSPSPQSDQSQPQRHSKDENFLSSPLCSSLLLELPPSPSNGLPLAPALPPPPPPPICTTPPPSSTASRKRRAVVTFDPADWLESLTSGLRPLTPPAAPFMETDFGLDSDLNVNRVLDLMVEQW